MSEDPKWTSGDPQRWDTFWRAGYTLDGAEAVTVERCARNEKLAVQAASDALHEALEKVRDLGLRVAGSAWVVKHQAGRQEREWAAETVKELEVQPWYGQRLAVTLKGMPSPAQPDDRDAHVAGGER